MNSFAHKLVVNPWLNPNQIEFPWLERCEKDYETLKNTKLPKQSGTPIVPQKIWDMEKIPVTPETKEGLVPEKSIFELLAWYQPLHNHTLLDYGIYLTDVGIVKVAESLQLGLTEHNIRLTRRQLLFWAAHVLYLHELGHALIERLVYAMETNNEQYYSKAANTYHGFIFMEEALCNTFVCGMHPLVIEKYCPAEFSELNQHTHVMKDVLIDFMRKQPPGYCNFLPIPVPPHRSHGFIENIKALLLHIYEIQESSQEHGVRKLLNGVAAYIWTKSWPNLEDLHFESWPDQLMEPSATCPFDVMLQELLPWQTPVYVLDHAENEVWDISCMARTTVRWEKDWVLKNLENKSLLTMINSNVMEKLKDIMEEGKITGSVYFGPYSLKDPNKDYRHEIEELKNLYKINDLYKDAIIVYLPEIEEINGDFICDKNDITSLTQIHKKIKSIKGYAYFTGNNIKSSVLGLVKVVNLERVILHNSDNPELERVSEILNKYLV
jgi:hypothetical protein